MKRALTTATALVLIASAANAQHFQFRVTDVSHVRKRPRCGTYRSGFRQMRRNISCVMSSATWLSLTTRRHVEYTTLPNLW